MDNRHQEIMIELLYEGRMAFQQLINHLGVHGLSSNRNKTRERLTYLLEKGFVREENRKTWKQGQKLWFSLTEKGMEESFRRVSEELNKESKSLVETSGRLLSDGSKLLIFSRLEKRLWADFRERSGSLEERIDRLEAGKRELYGDLVESYKNVHRLVQRLLLDPFLGGKRAYLGVSEDGGVEVITEDMIKTKRFSRARASDTSV